MPEGVRHAMAERLQESIIWQLIRAQRGATRRLVTLLRPLGVTPGQWLILTVLAREDGQPIHAVGEQGPLDGPTMTGLVDRLERDGLVERRRNRQNRRSIGLFLTNRGRELVDRAPGVREDLDRALLDGLTEDQQEQFLAVLRRGIANLEAAQQAQR